MFFGWKLRPRIFLSTDYTDYLYGKLEVAAASFLFLHARNYKSVAGCSLCPGKGF